MSVMTSFKRKRIEKWCDDVAQYLKNGTICTTIIGNIAEDAISCGNVHPAVMGVNNENMDCYTKINHTAANNNNDININAANAINGNLNAKVDLALKKATQALTLNDDFFKRDGGINGGGVDMTACGGGGGDILGSFPEMKFAYSRYHEQRRKIDRLVQGLPVLNASGISTLNRPSSKASTEDHVPIIIANGEEPVRSSHARSWSSSQQRLDSHSHPHLHHHPAGYRSSPLTPSSHINNVHNPHYPRSQTGVRNSLITPSSNFRHNSKKNNNNNAGPAQLRRGGSGGRLYDSRPPPPNATAATTTHMAVSIDPDLCLSANDRISRMKTAPAPNRNLHRARQRILTRRSDNRIIEHPSQIPLHNCWAMAEMTW